MVNVYVKSIDMVVDKDVDLAAINYNSHLLQNLLLTARHSFFPLLGSHLKSIEMVVNKDVDGAAIDSTTLALQMEKFPQLKQQLHILTSWGPLPIQPIIVRKSMTGQ